MDPFIGFIGGGNMASSLIAGLIRQGIPGASLGVAEPDAEKRRQLATSSSLLATPDNALIAQQADVLVLAVKPQALKAVSLALREPLTGRDPLVISIAAGIGTDALARWLGPSLPIVRAMPNTPALMGHGATGLFANAGVSEAQRQQAERLFNGVGIVRWLTDEAQLDLVTALSGSGPAYFFLFMEALTEGAQELGLDPGLARDLTLQTALGAAHMARDSGLGLDALRVRVTSPGGTTEQGLRVLEREGLRRIAREALAAAQARAITLAQELGEAS